MGAWSATEDDGEHRAAGRMNRGWTYRDRVRAADAGRTILEFYAGRYDHTDTSGWREAILDGRVRRNGGAAQPDDRLAAGDLLEYLRPPWREPPAPTDLAVLFEDDALLAVSKPSGLPVLPGGEFLETTLLALVRAGDPARARWSPVHRLGRGTSGVVLVGKTAAARRALAEALAGRRAAKLYLGVAEGVALPDRFAAEWPIGVLEHPAIGPVHAACAWGKPARTIVRVLARDARRGLSLVLARLVTGRPHQMRIHLAAAGAPLWGDPFYVTGGVPRGMEHATGTPLDEVSASAEAHARVGDCGYRLHAWRVRVPHPDSGRALAITAPVPAEFFEGTAWRADDLATLVTRRSPAPAEESLAGLALPSPSHLNRERLRAGAIGEAGV